MKTTWAIQQEKSSAFGKTFVVVVVSFLFAASLLVNVKISSSWQAEKRYLHAPEGAPSIKQIRFEKSIGFSDFRTIQKLCGSEIGFQIYAFFK